MHDATSTLQQVILTGEPLHKVAPAPAQPPPPPTPAPADAEAAAAAAASAGSGAAAAAGAGGAADGSGGVLPFSINDPGESHTLRPYWEYLCYLFRYVRADAYSLLSMCCGIASSPCPVALLGPGPCHWPDVRLARQNCKQCAGTTKHGRGSTRGTVCLSFAAGQLANQ